MTSNLKVLEIKACACSITKDSLDITSETSSYVLDLSESMLFESNDVLALLATFDLADESTCVLKIEADLARDCRRISVQNRWICSATSIKAVMPWLPSWVAFVRLL